MNFHSFNFVLRILYVLYLYLFKNIKKNLIKKWLTSFTVYKYPNKNKCYASQYKIFYSRSVLNMRDKSVVSVIDLTNDRFRIILVGKI